MKTVKELVNECFKNNLAITFKKDGDKVQVIVGSPNHKKASQGLFHANIMDQPDDVFESILSTVHAQLGAKIAIPYKEKPLVPAEPVITDRLYDDLPKEDELPAAAQKLKSKKKSKPGKDEEESE